jgi:hypothetical protein
MRSGTATCSCLSSTKLLGLTLLGLLSSSVFATTVNGTPASAATLPSSLVQGAYATPGTPAGVAAFGKKTDTSPTLNTEFLPVANGWTAMDGGTKGWSRGSLQMMLKDWGNKGYAVALAVPMIPTQAGRADGTLADGAAGDYNTYFTTLAENLVAGGLPHAYLRLGWEFDVNRYPWKAYDPKDTALDPTLEQEYAQYFQQIVTTMRGVSGADFKFVWNPLAASFDPGRSPASQADPNWTLSAAYPGNAYVDYVGLDLYDLQPWSTIDQELTDAQTFASQMGKPIAFCEWAVVSKGVLTPGANGDDPTFVNNMAAWMATPGNDVAWESYLDGDGLGANYRITGGAFPKSLAAFKADFG